MALGRTATAQKSIDWITFSLYLSLVFIGWLMIFAAEYTGAEDWFSLSTSIGKQTLWMAIGFIVLLVVLNIDWKFWRNFSYILYAASMLLLVAVLFLGLEVNGARSWFNLFGFTLQPAEIAKFTTALAVSSYLSGPTSKLRSLKNILVAIGLFVAPMILVILQPDPGSALVFLSFFILLYREGLSPLLYVFAIITMAVFILALSINPLSVVVLLSIAAIFIVVQNLAFRLYWNLSVLVLTIASIICINQGFEREILFVNGLVLLFLLFSRP